MSRKSAEIVFIRYIDTVLEKKKSEENKMFGFGQLIRNIKEKTQRKSYLQKGEDPRILEAASRLLASNFLHPTLSEILRRLVQAPRRAVSISVEQRL